MFLSIPYDTKKVFEITSNTEHTITVKTIEDIYDTFDVIVIDGLYKNWESLREILLKSPSYIFNIHESTNNRNGIDYYDCRCILSPKNSPCLSYIREIIYKHFNILTNSDVKDLVYSNWFYLLKNKTSSYALPHVDCFDTYTNPLKQFTILTYLNKEEECYGGTGFYRNKYLNSVYPYNKYGLDYSNLTQLCPHVEHYQPNFILPLNYSREWKLIDYIPMKPNRTVIFPSNIFHGAYIPTNAYKHIPRINMVTWEVEKQTKDYIVR
jgi:hypothetical protein